MTPTPPTPEPSEMQRVIPISCTIECCAKCERLLLNDREREQCPRCMHRPPLTFGADAEWRSRQQFGRLGMVTGSIINRLGLHRRMTQAEIDEREQAQGQDVEAGDGKEG